MVTVRAFGSITSLSAFVGRPALHGFRIPIQLGPLAAAQIA